MKYSPLSDKELQEMARDPGAYASWSHIPDLVAEITYLRSVEGTSPGKEPTSTRRTGSENYQPLSDEELEPLIEFYAEPKNRGVTTWLEQGRRANRLAAAVREFLNEFVDKTGQASELDEALREYLGED